MNTRLMIVAGVAVALDHQAGVVPAEHHHALGRPLEELLVYRDSPVAVLLGDDLGPRHVVRMHEGKARCVLRGRRCFHACSFQAVETTDEHG